MSNTKKIVLTITGLCLIVLSVVLSITAFGIIDFDVNKIAANGTQDIIKITYDYGDLDQINFTEINPKLVKFHKSTDDKIYIQYKQTDKQSLKFIANGKTLTVEKHGSIDWIDVLKLYGELKIQVYCPESYIDNITVNNQKVNFTK